jgi:hypothetical protein
MGLPLGTWVSFDFDRFIIFMGQWVESQRYTYDKKGKQTDHIETLLSEHGKTPWATKRYSNPETFPQFEVLPLYTKEQWLADKAKETGKIL